MLRQENTDTRLSCLRNFACRTHQTCLPGSKSFHQSSVSSLGTNEDISDSLSLPQTKPFSSLLSRTVTDLCLGSSICLLVLASDVLLVVGRHLSEERSCKIVFVKIPSKFVQTATQTYRFENSKSIESPSVSYFGWMSLSSSVGNMPRGFQSMKQMLQTYYQLFLPKPLVWQIAVLLLNHGGQSHIRGAMIGSARIVAFELRSSKWHYGSAQTRRASDTTKSGIQFHVLLANNAKFAWKVLIHKTELFTCCCCSTRVTLLQPQSTWTVMRF